MDLGYEGLECSVHRRLGACRHQEHWAEAKPETVQTITTKQRNCSTLNCPQNWTLSISNSPMLRLF